MSEEKELGYINIRVTDENVVYDTEFSLPDVIFWLEILKSMAIKKVIEDAN